MADKNVLVLIPHFGKGGAERSASKIAAALSDHFNVTVCAFTDAYPLHYGIGKANVVYIDTLLKKKQQTNKIRRWMGRIKTLKQLKRDLKIDICISFLEGADYLNVIT